MSEGMKLAMVGKPNVGKSSLCNRLLGERRLLVSATAGTTVDAVDTELVYNDRKFILIDTAGLRKKRNVTEDLEFYSVMRSIRALEESDVCLLMIDATAGITSQDLKIFHLCERNRKGVVILVNKWDLMEKDTNTTKKMEAAIRERIAPFEDVPIVFTSATTKQRVHKALETAVNVFKNKTQKVPTSKLNKLILPYIDNYPPPSIKGKNINIKYITQLPGFAPTFAFFCNYPQYVQASYKRFLENKMREDFDFSGVTLTL